MIKHTNNIKDMIDKSGLKQTHIADSLGFHPADISHWISGRRLMRKSVCRDMAELLNCRMCDLYPNLAIYKDSNKHKYSPLTIRNLLSVLEYSISDNINEILSEFNLSIDTIITDRKFLKLRTKMKGVE
jgi:DNA-binding XRE family transcriptional regulator